MSTEKPPTNLYTALLAAQRDFSAVVKNKQNPHLKNYYADLGAVLDAVTEPLTHHGLLIVQRFGGDQGGPILITELVHVESGQIIASTLPIVTKDPTDPQKLGGAITYARRYSLLALLGLAPEDDDGHAASQPRPPPAPARNAAPACATPRPAPAPSPNLEAVRGAMADQDFYATPEGAMDLLQHAKTKEDAELARKKCQNLGIEPKEWQPVYNDTIARLRPAAYAG